MSSKGFCLFFGFFFGWFVFVTGNIQIEAVEAYYWNIKIDSLLIYILQDLLSRGISIEKSKKTKYALWI